jgi:hypothetical protein
MQLGTLVVESCTLVGVDSRQRPRNKPSGEDLPFDAALNASAAGPSGFVPYERKRWTGPEWSRGAVPSDRIEGLPNHRPVDPRTCRL